MGITMIVLIVEYEPPEPTVKQNDGDWLEVDCDPVYVSIMGKN
jgi:hypothetical protein